MMELTIEGLQRYYQVISKEIESEEAYGALHCLIDMLLPLSTAYRGMTPAQMFFETGKDWKFITGEMSASEELARIEHIYDLIKSQNN